VVVATVHPFVIQLISPTPLLMVVSENDGLTPTDLAIEAYGRAMEPKKLDSRRALRCLYRWFRAVVNTCAQLVQAASLEV